MLRRLGIIAAQPRAYALCRQGKKGQQKCKVPGKGKKYKLFGGLEHLDYFPITLGMSSSQLIFTPSFFRGVGSTTNQP